MFIQFTDPETEKIRNINVSGIDEINEDGDGWRIKKYDGEEIYVEEKGIEDQISQFLLFQIKS